MSQNRHKGTWQLSHPKRPAVAVRVKVRGEIDDWDEDGVELHPLVESKRVGGEAAVDETNRQRNAAIGYCCVMFLCCLGAQFSTHVDPDAIRNKIPFIMHSCDGKGCEHILMVQVYELSLPNILYHLRVEV